jgi:tetratricopeptide (TPR) repeat protein
MLFDLRGRGRRRTVQVIYVILALLLGGGLVLFGIGGDVQGGLFDAFREGGGSANDAIEQEVERAEERVQANRQDAGGWARLATARYQLAGVSEGFNREAQDPSQQFTGEARGQLEQAARAWDQHVRLAGDRPDSDAAAIMRNAFLSLGEPERAVRAQEIVLDANPNPGVGDFSQLAALAYQAGQMRKGDLAADRAVELAPRGQRREVRRTLEQQKTQAAQGAGGAAGGGAGAAGGATPAPAPAPEPAP